MENNNHSPDDQRRKRIQRYWRNNIRIIIFILVVWFLVSFVFGIFLVEPLNRFKLAGLSWRGFLWGFGLLSKGPFMYLSC